MKTPGCERYLEDPEGNASHLEDCADCRAFFGVLDAPPSYHPVAMRALPLAAWEGARHRAWAVVVFALALVLAIAVTLFAMSGVGPVAGFAQSLFGNLPPLDFLKTLLQHAPGAVQNAPTGWQLAIVISFLVVNTLLVVLLRRAPRGVDADV